MRHPVVTFNAGELSPLVDARSDVDKYRAGCRTLENMIPRIYGPAERRPGTKYVDTCNGVARVIPFIYSNEIAYVLLLEDQRMYFYYNGGRVLDADGRRLMIDTPYLAADLFQIQYKQSNDVMWLVHPDYAPRKLKRTSANSFELEEIIFSNGPFKKRNDLAVGDGVTLTPSATSVSSSEDVSDDAGCVYTASTVYDTSTNADHAFDDLLIPPGSYWQAATAQITNQWVACQWTSGQNITRVRIAPHVAPPNPLLLTLPDWAYNPEHIRIDACNDGVSWQKVPINGWSGNCSAWNNDEALLGHITSPTEWVDLTLNNAASFQYYRVYIYDNYSGFILRLHEIEFIETTATWGDAISLMASGPVFDVGHVGVLFSLTQQRVNTEITGSMTYPNTGYIGDPLLVEGDFTFTTHGTWTGTIILERSIDQVVWETYRKWVSEADTNVQYTGTEEEVNVYYRINVSAMSANTAAGTTRIPSKVVAELTVNSSTQTGICRATGFTDAYTVSIDVLKPFASTDSTVRWAEGCWSDYRGFPTAVTFFKERCIYGGTPHQPQTIWLSAVDDFENYEECTKDDSSFSLTISSDTRCAIQWISALEAVIIGTAGSEWRLRSTAFDDPLTPTNYSLTQQTSYGSKDIQALPINDVILFADFVGRRIREATYKGDKDKYVAPDLCALAEHVTKTGITSMAFQKNPDPILWCTRTDGTLLSMTYERDQDVIAWARHPMKVGPGTSGELTGGTQVRLYPTLQELTAAEIPAAAAEPTMTAAVTEVANAVALQAMTGSGKYYLSADIDLTGVTWTPITNFAGVLDGRGYTISNLTISAATSDNRALFGTIAAGFECYDLTMNNCTVTGQDSASILVGGTAAATANFKIKGVNITNCTLTGRTIVGPLFASGYGFRTGTIYNCHATNCTINAVDNAGGLLGYMEPGASATGDYDVVNCSVVGGTLTMATNGDNCGGFVGYGGSGNPGDMTITYHTCTTSTAIVLTSSAGATVTSVGGFAGFLTASFNDAGSTRCISCSATGDIDITGPNGAFILQGVGGFVGFHSSASYINCYTTSDIDIDVTGSAAVGPTVILIGGFGGKWDVDYPEQALRCYSTGDVNIAMPANTLWYGIGGFIGGYLGTTATAEGGTISRCWSEGDVTMSYDGLPSTDYNGGLGGFIGYIQAIDNGATVRAHTISNCYAWGSIVITSDDGAPERTSVGGFIGAEYDENAGNYIVTNITNCYCAQTDTAAGNSYTGQIPSRAKTNGFFGKAVITAASVTLATSYFDTQTSSWSLDDYATGNITDWMQTKTNYEDAGWDFDTIWYIPDDTTYDYTSSGLGPNSVACIPGSTEDEVWLVVVRVIGGSIVRFVEQMQPRNVDDQEDQWFVDSGLDYDGAATSTFSGLDHLEGEEVAILAGGAVYTRQTVSSGSITLPESTTRAIVGLPFRHILKPMRFDLSVPGGNTKGSLKTFKELVISFYRAGNVYYGVDEDHLHRINFRTEEAYGSPPALYTGDMVVTHEGGFSVEDSIIVTSDDPVPCTVRALVPRIDISGR